MVSSEEFLQLMICMCTCSWVCVQKGAHSLVDCSYILYATAWFLSEGRHCFVIILIFKHYLFVHWGLSLYFSMKKMMCLSYGTKCKLFSLKD